jgi:hypothetical protein
MRAPAISQTGRTGTKQVDFAVFNLAAPEPPGQILPLFNLAISAGCNFATRRNSET